MPFLPSLLTSLRLNLAIYSQHSLILEMFNLTLLKHPGRVLPIAKLKSLAKKYFSIPVKYRTFYPQALKTEAKKLARETGLIARKRKKKSSVAGKRKVKRKVG